MRKFKPDRCALCGGAQEEVQDNRTISRIFKETMQNRIETEGREERL